MDYGNYKNTKKNMPQYKYRLNKKKKLLLKGEVALRRA